VGKGEKKRCLWAVIVGRTSKELEGGASPNFDFVVFERQRGQQQEDRGKAPPPRGWGGKEDMVGHLGGAKANAKKICGMTGWEPGSESKAENTKGRKVALFTRGMSSGRQLRKGKNGPGNDLQRGKWYRSEQKRGEGRRV